MAVKSFGFKRIAKEPLPVTPPVVPDTSVTITGEWPTRDDIAKMSASEAFHAGEKIGEFLKAARVITQGVAMPVTTPVITTVPAAVKPPMAMPSKVTVGTVTTLFKKSDTGIGYKQWSIWLEGDYVVVEWGHCDKAKQQKRHSFLSRPASALAWMHDAITAKQKKGYRRTK